MGLNVSYTVKSPIGLESMIPRSEQERIDNVISGVALLDKNGIVQAVNRAWTDLAKVNHWPSEAEIIGQPYAQCCPLRISDVDVENGIKSILDGKISEFVQHYSTGHYNGERYLELYAEPYHGSIDGVLVKLQEVPGHADINSVDSNFHSVLFESLADGIIYQNARGLIELANPAAEKILGMPLADMLGKNLTDLCIGYVDAERMEVCPDRFPFVIALRLQQSHRGFTVGIPSDDNGLRWIRIDSEIVWDQEKQIITGVLTSFVDITNETLAKQKVEKVTERLHLALDGAGIGVWDWYVKENEMHWDEKAYQLYGYTPETELTLSQIWERGVHPDDRSRVEDEMRDMVKRKKEAISEFRIVWPDESIRYLRAHARVILDDAGGVVRVVGMNWDVTRQVESERRLQEIAYTDELTKIANRASFYLQLDNAIKIARLDGKKIGLLVMDIDHFKDLNDSFGHLIGDSLLIELVRRLIPIIPSSYIFARLGGDEFGILVPNMDDSDKVQKIAAKIQKSLLDPIYLLDGPAVNTQVSIGISIFPDDGKDSVELIKSADLAMYSTKMRGRNDVTVYEKSMSDALNKKVTLEYLLREAIREEVFELYYQPIVDLSTEEVIGCEALMRWRGKDGKFISPMDFIPVAEGSGLIYEMGKWINKTALQQLHMWQTLTSTMEYMSVNVSPHQLQNPDFVDDLTKMIEFANIDPGAVQLEITEGTFLQESLSAESHLNRLGEMGFRLAIDDFGTGYSSLAYLKRFNVDVIKIDKSFVEDIERDTADRDIVRAILAMTNSLGFKTLVEGVERNEQIKIVKELGCDFAQGYRYSRPLPAEEFAEKFLNNS